MKQPEVSLEDLSWHLIEAFHLTDCGAKPGWLANPKFWPAGDVPDDWQANEPTAADAKTAVKNYDRVLDRWRWLMTLPVWDRVPGVFPAVVLRLAENAAGLRRFAAPALIRQGEYRSAIDGLSRALGAVQIATRDQVAFAHAAISVASEPVRRRMSANDVMLQLLESNSEARDWTVEQFAFETGFAKSTIHGTSMWKRLQNLRGVDIVSRGERDRRRTGRKRKSEPDE